MDLRLAFATLLLGCFTTACGGGTFMLAPSDSRTAYVVKRTLLGTTVLHCQAKEGANPDPVCTEVRETSVRGGAR
jgi:hypothetical protein